MDSLMPEIPYRPLLSVFRYSIWIFLADSVARYEAGILHTVMPDT